MFACCSCKSTEKYPMHVAPLTNFDERDQDSKQEASGFLGDILDTMEKDKISSFELQIEEKIEDEEMR